MSYSQTSRLRLHVHTPCFVDGLEDKGVALRGGGASHRVGGVVCGNHFKLKGKNKKQKIAENKQ